jgi:uncharacterized membrane protein
MQVIGIKARDRDEGIFILNALETAVKNHKVVLDDIALVTRDAEGKVKIEQTKDVTPAKGAGKGALVGALVGLAAPPLLAAAIVGTAVGAIWGKYGDHGIEDATMKSIGDMLAQGEAVVFALGSDEAIAAVTARVAEVTEGHTETFTMPTKAKEKLHEASAELPTPEENSYLEAMAVDYSMPETMPTRYSV